MSAAMVFSAAARGQVSGLNMSDNIKEYLGQALPPYTGVVSFAPESPAAGEEVTVTASIAMLSLSEDIDNSTSVDAAILHYTTDFGASWSEVEMEQDDDNEELWNGVIPGQDADAQVEFYVTAASEAGTLNISMGPAQVDLNIGQKQNIGLNPSANLAGYNPDNADDSPFDHLFLVAQDPADEEIVAGADIRELRFGYDADSFYWRLKFEKKIDPGTLSPLNPRIYIGFILNLNRGFDDFDATKAPMKDYVEQIQKMFPIQDQDAMLREGSKRIFAWLWAPTLSGLPIPGLGALPKEPSLLKLNPANISMPTFDTKNCKTEIREDGAVDIKIAREALGDETDSMLFLFGNLEASGSMSDLKSIKVSVPDLAYPTIIKLTDYKYTVGS